MTGLRRIRRPVLVGVTLAVGAALPMPTLGLLSSYHTRAWAEPRVVHTGPEGGKVDGNPFLVFNYIYLE